MPRAQEVGIPMENLLIDPLVLTVSGCQHCTKIHGEKRNMIRWFIFHQK